MKIFKRTDETKHLRYGEDLGLQAAFLTYIYTYPHELADHCRDDNCRRFLNVVCKHLEGSDFTRYQAYHEIKKAIEVLRYRKGLIMEFAGIEPLKNLFGEPFIWYDDDVHFQFVDKTIVFPSEKTKQIMRTQGIDYREVQGYLYSEWQSRKNVYFPRKIEKLDTYGIRTYMTEDYGVYDCIPVYGHEEYEKGLW